MGVCCSGLVSKGCEFVGMRGVGVVAAPLGMRIWNGGGWWGRGAGICGVTAVMMLVLVSRRVVRNVVVWEVARDGGGWWGRGTGSGGVPAGMRLVLCQAVVESAALACQQGGFVVVVTGMGWVVG